MKKETRQLPLKEILFGGSSFYGHALAIAMPIIIQNTLTNIVGLLDNVMVGQIGTVPMSAVTIVNQLMLVFYVCVWGAGAGAGIFGAQYFGKGDLEGFRQTLRFKLVMLVLFAVLMAGVFYLAGGSIIRLYLPEGTDPAAAEETCLLAEQYLKIMLAGFLPFAVTQAVSSALREAACTGLPMTAGICAMTVNFVFNALLIFGLFGFPRLGVAGAAIATVLSRFAELAIVLAGARAMETPRRVLKGTLASFRVPARLTASIMRKAFPLMANEFLWSSSEAALLSGYARRGIMVIAAVNIASTVMQVFNQISLSFGNAASIIVGHELGAERFEDAKHASYRMMFMSVALCTAAGALLFLIAPVIPSFYNTEEEVRHTACLLIRVMAVWLPGLALANVAYFTVRSGGKVLITFLFDSFYAWTVKVPVLFLLMAFTGLSVVPVYFIIMGLEFVKGLIGLMIVRRGRWMRNLVGGAAEQGPA